MKQKRTQEVMDAYNNRKTEQTERQMYDALEEVPMELRLRVVYTPLLLEDICILLVGAIRSTIVESAKEKAKRVVPTEKDKQLKRDMRVLKDRIDEYERETQNAYPDKWMSKMIRESSMQMYGDIVGVVSQSRYAFKNQIWKERKHLDDCTADTIALCYVVRMLIKYDWDVSSKMVAELNNLIPKGHPGFEINRGQWIYDVYRCMKSITTTYYGLPEQIECESVDMCRRVLDNKIKSTNFEKYNCAWSCSGATWKEKQEYDNQK